MSIRDCGCDNCKARMRGTPAVTLTRGGCRCDYCKGLRRDEDVERLKADRARRYFHGESDADQRMREADEVFQRIEAARKALLIDDLRKSTQRRPMSSPFNTTGYISLGSSVFPMSSLSISYDPPKETKKPMYPPNDITTTDGLVNTVKAIAGKDENVDLSKVASAVKEIEAERKDRIGRALKGVADLAVLSGPKGRRFVVAYWSARCGEAKTAYGIEYPVQRDDKENVKGYSVYIDDIDHPFSVRYETMKEFREYLEKAKITAHIAYFDK